MVRQAHHERNQLVQRFLKYSLALVFGLHAMQGESAERLGGISDETAAPVHQPEQAAEREGGIVYRVICSPEGEMLPECMQPPVSDSFEAAQPRLAEPENPANAEMPKELAGQGDQPVNVRESVTPKEAAAHNKKRSKSSVKKSAKKTHKPVKKPKRR